MAKKRDIEEEINDFLAIWGSKELISFLNEVIPLLELYDVDEKDDWVEKDVGGDEENIRTIRLIRTVYLISRIAELHAGKLSIIKMRFKDLWKRMEKQGIHETADKEGSSAQETQP